MPDKPWIRVEDKRTGHQYSVRNPNEQHHKVLDKPAATADGRPLPAKPKRRLETPAGQPAVKPYDKWLKPALEAEVEKRNTDRDGDHLVVVEGNGTVADLAAALEADDNYLADLA